MPYIKCFYRFFRQNHKKNRKIVLVDVIFLFRFKTKQKILWFKYKKFQKTNRPSKLPKYLHFPKKKNIYIKFSIKHFFVGFGTTTMIINGEKECGPSPPNQNASPNRQTYYRLYADMFKVREAVNKSFFRNFLIEV